MGRPPWTPEGYEDAGDHVVVYIRFTARGRGSGIDITQPMARVCTMRAGRLARHQTFWDREAARDAVGLTT
jgi:ketosteroid isomerase-like protein